MDRARIGKHQASFPRGYQVGPIMRATFRAAEWSRRLRAFYFGLPHSRLRTWLVAGYYHRQAQELRDGNFSKGLSAVEGELNLFGIETYSGPEGWADALRSWRATFSDSHAFDLVKFVNAPGSSYVLQTLYIGGRAAASSIDMDEVAYIVLRVERGMAVEGHLLRSQASALEAAGLLESDS